MGNGESSTQTCYFGADVPDQLRAEQESLDAVQAGLGSASERAALQQFLEIHASPLDLAENRPLCEFIALCCLRFRRFDVATAAARFQKYMQWRRTTFGNLGPQDVDAVCDVEKEEKSGLSKPSSGSAQDASGGDADTTRQEEEHVPLESSRGAGTALKKKTTRALLDLNVITILPQPTAQGQAMMLLRLANTRPSEFVYHARQVCKAAHFQIMDALRRMPTAQVKGLVVMVDFGHTGMSNIDRKVPPKMGKLFSGILPVRLAGILVCNPNMLVRIVVPLAKMFLSEKLASYVLSWVDCRHVCRLVVEGSPSLYTPRMHVCM